MFVHEFFGSVAFSLFSDRFFWAQSPPIGVSVSPAAEVFHPKTWNCRIRLKKPQHTVQGGPPTIVMNGVK